MRLRTAIVALTGIVGLLWSSAADARQAPTFTKDVAPILYKNCSQCHRPNEVAPMPLMTYEQARPWARSIKSKVLKKEMPPWGVGESSLKFSNDRQMSEKEIFTLVAWVDAGAPKGNDADLPAPPAYPGGWKFNREPDVVIKMPVEFTIEPRSEYPMLDFYVPIPWSDGMKLIQMSEARPVEQGGRPSHHGQPRDVPAGHGGDRRPAVHHRRVWQESAARSPHRAHHRTEASV